MASPPSSDAQDLPLGWGLNHRISNEFSDCWPVLSREEQELIRDVLEDFYRLPADNQNTSDLEKTLGGYCRAHFFHVDEEQWGYLLSILRQHALKEGPLTPLVQNPLLEEIAISGIGISHPVRVYHAQKGWTNTPLFFSDENSLITLLNRLALSSGKRLSALTPILNAQLEGNHRLHATIHPVCLSRVEASIRKYVVRATQPRDLLSTNVISSRALAFLVLAMQSDCNVLIVGNTGSGKTTTLNALLGCLPHYERMILVEETPELHVSHEHVVRLTSSSSENASMPTLIRETLRMRPDRVVVGEIRFPEEARAFMESVLAGQGKGTYATFHGHSSLEALTRLRQFGLLENDLGWMNIIVVQRRWSERDEKNNTIDKRAVCEIVELVRDASSEKDVSIQTWKIRPIFQWSATERKLLFTQPSILARERFSWCFPIQTWEKEWDILAQNYSQLDADEPFYAQQKKYRADAKRKASVK